jgi:hypothetical protein
MTECQDILCRTGDLLLPKRIRSVLEEYWIGDDQSRLYLTNWSLVHLGSGVLLAWLFPTLTLWTAFSIHTAWELWQILVRNTPWWTLRGQLDVIVDTVLFLLGVHGVRALR